jgi:uncharacterized protein YqjF (DUF2071 family)
MRNDFLVAHWENLVVATFEAAPQLLLPYLPRGTELNEWNGKYCMSLVGFHFSKASFCGIPSPFYRSFPEVNLRFYVREKVKSGWRKGVVFIKELVPSRLVGWVAKWLYHESFSVLPIRQSSFEDNDGRHFEYHWKINQQPNYLKCCCSHTAATPETGSLAAFIHDHCTAYTKKDNNRTYTFTIDHPEWKIYPGLSYALQLDAASMYGTAFGEAFQQNPLAVFLLDGSKTTVSSPRLL